MKLTIKSIFTILLLSTVFLSFNTHQSLAYTSLKIDPVTNASPYVEGTGQKGWDVYVVVDDEIIGESHLYTSEFSAEIPKLKAGKKYYIYYVYDGETYQIIEGNVEDAIAPKKPSVEWPTETVGFINGNGENNAMLYAYVNGKKIGSAKAESYGSFSIPIPQQKAGTIIDVFQKDKAGNKSESVLVRVGKSPSKTKKQLSKKRYSEVEKQKIMNEFLKWAGTQAKSKKLAVTDIWFNHGAGGRGDWYADTPQGEVQIQELNNPGYYGFSIHAIGGLVFYKQVDGLYGVSQDVASEPTYAGYLNVSKKKTDIKKYMLGDNGIVYEAIKVREKSYFGFGAAEYSDQGVRGKYVPDVKFKVSKDKAAQLKLQEILRKYQ